MFLKENVVLTKEQALYLKDLETNAYGFIDVMLEERGARDYQVKAIKAVLNSDGNTLLVSPTGSGKTFMAKQLCDFIEDRILFVTPRIDLVTQTAEAFNNDCDLLWKRYIDTGKKVTIASRQTLMHRDLDLSNFVAIFDEVHVGLPKTKELVDKFHFKRVIGLTATPEREDLLSFVKNPEGTCRYNIHRYDYAIFDNVVTAGTIKSLQEQGYLAELEYNANRESRKLLKIRAKLSKGKQNLPEMQYEDMADVVESDLNKANLLAFLKEHEDQKPFLVFTPDVKSANKWTDFLNKSDYKFKSISGETPKAEREEIYRQLREGELDGVTNCALLTYGFDLPCAKTVVLIRNIRSRPLYIQTIGRVLRPYENKKAVVYDMGGSNWNFCTLKNPNLFESEIEYEVEGLDIKKDQAYRGSEDSFEEIVDLVGEDNVVRYVKDPVSVLIDAIYQYRSTLDALNDELDKQAEKYEEKLKDMRSINTRLTLKLLNVKTKVEQPKEIRQPSESPISNWHDWFKTESFTWFQKNFPRQILRPLKYDKSQFEDQDVKNKVYTETLRKIPVVIPKDDIKAALKQIMSLSKWWLQRFQLNWQPSDSKPLTQSAS